MTGEERRRGGKGGGEEVGEGTVGGVIFLYEREQRHKWDRRCFTKHLWS